MSDATWNPRRFEEARRQLRDAPARLTDTDLEHLSMFDPELAQHGFEQRFKSLHPNTDPAPALTPAREPMDKATADQFAEAVVALIVANVKPLAARLEAQEQRIAALEARPALKFVGPYREGTQYLAGSITQRQGLWLAEADTHATPGEDDSGWRLILKAAPK